jgi:nitrogen-specific signal transduction histidine kinase
VTFRYKAGVALVQDSRVRIHIAGSTVFKLFLLTAVVVVSFVFIWYTYDVIRQLQDEAQEKVASFVRLWVKAVDPATPSAETQLIFDEIISRANFPIIVASAEREPNFWRNIPGVADTDRSAADIQKIMQLMEEMKQAHGEIEIVFGDSSDTLATSGVGINYFYYGDSHLVENLKIAPYIQIAMVISVLSIGVVGFTNIKKSDERHIWVGMAKETAHQLGTPISALMGWLELLKERCANSPEMQSPVEAEVGVSLPMALDSMSADVERLKKVANRFGKIGSAPELTVCEFDQSVRETVEYFQQRLAFGNASVKVSFEPGGVEKAMMNPELFGWTIENLIRNAIDAVDSESGRIALHSSVSSDGRRACLEVSDNGRGIPLGVQRRIFRAGFSSKKRGWGLGLTLARRIIEEYHGGKLSLLRSAPGETVFSISIPTARVSSTKSSGANVLSGMKE